MSILSIDADVMAAQRLLTQHAQDLNAMHDGLRVLAHKAGASGLPLTYEALTACAGKVRSAQVELGLAIGTLIV